MDSPPAFSRFPSRGRRDVGLSRFAAAVAAAFVIFGILPAHGQTPVTVPNYSFESPTTSFVSTVITSWQKLPQPADFNPDMGFTWDDLAGAFANDPPPASDNITNMDGNQAAYIFGDQGVGLLHFEFAADWRRNFGLRGG